MSTPPNPLPCGCRAVGVAHLDGYGSEYTLVQTYRDVHVQHCHLHAQAEGMRDTLRALVNGIEAYCTSGDHNALDLPYDTARALLRAVGTK